LYASIVAHIAAQQDRPFIPDVILFTPTIILRMVITPIVLKQSIIITIRVAFVRVIMHNSHHEFTAAMHDLSAKILAVNTNTSYVILLPLK
jgi:hypothetical protein